MNKQYFIDLFGEDPEDMFGPDWENEVEDLELLELTDKQDSEANNGENEFLDR